MTTNTGGDYADCCQDTVETPVVRIEKTDFSVAGFQSQATGEVKLSIE